MINALFKLSTPSATNIFRQMGYGIKKRNKLFGCYWSEHQQQCFALQKQWIETAVHVDHALILGAGFLFDLDQQLFASTFSKLTFVDGNPQCRANWRRFRHNNSVDVEERIEEISTAIGPWRSELAKGLHKKISWDDALQNVKAFSKCELPRSSFFGNLSSSSVVSLNLLSQLPLAWQEIVESCLSNVFGKRFVVERQDEWLQAFLPSATLLVEQHLRDLIESGAQSILIITDKEYCNYQLPKYFRGAQPTVSYHDKLGWQRRKEALPDDVELTMEITPALYGVELDKWLKQVAQNFLVGSLSTWLWHIAPPGAEGRNKGLTHLVQGIFLTRNPE